MMMARGAESRGWGWLLLFASSTTLVCCALPILLVSLGLGAVSAALFANLPFLSALALHKGWLFAASGGLLAVAGWALFRPGRACPADPALAEKCAQAHRWNARLFGASALIWTIGFVAAYLALPVYNLLESIGG